MTFPPKHFLEAFSCRLAYIESGQGVTIVCLHSLLDCSDTFVPLMSELSFARVIALDLPGAGESSLPKDPFYSIATTSRYVAEALEQKDLSKVILVGHQQGAGVAAWLAALDPERVAGLCLLGAALSDNSADTFGLRLSRHRPFRWLSRYALGELSFRWRLRSSMNSSANPERAVRLSRFFSQQRQDRLLLLQSFPLKEKEDLERRLLSVKVPVLVLRGEDDKFSAEKIKSWQEKLPELRVGVVPNSDQYPHEEKPTDVAKFIKDWVSLFMPVTAPINPSPPETEHPAPEQ